MKIKTEIRHNPRHIRPYLGILKFKSSWWSNYETIEIQAYTLEDCRKQLEISAQHIQEDVWTTVETSS